jgi:ribosomal protein S18 acetylase RimI-like enzyme
MARVIRNLEISDYDDLIRLWKRCGLTHRPLGRDSRDEIETLFRREDAFTLGLFLDGRLIGSVMGTSDGRKGWINRLAVDPGLRGDGSAAELIESCEERLHQRGIKVISSLIEEGNNASRAVFEKAGYEHWPEVLYFSKRASMDD